MKYQCISNCQCPLPTTGGSTQKLLNYKQPCDKWHDSLTVIVYVGIVKKIMNHKYWRKYWMGDEKKPVCLLLVPYRGTVW